MAIVAVAGDACTTTTVALAAAWPSSKEAFVVEADPSGGDLAAWFDLPVAPSLSTVVTRLSDGGWPEIDRLTRRAECGVRLIPAPVSTAEARQAVSESARSLVPTLAMMSSPVAIVDTGDLSLPPVVNAFVAVANLTVLVHRQSSQSPRAAAVRMQRLADQIDVCRGSTAGVVVAVIGAAPFDIGQIESFIADSAGATPVIGLPVDDLTASVYAGRTGVSPRRLARLPLSRAARELAGVVESVLDDRIETPWSTAR